MSRKHWLVSHTLALAATIGSSAIEQSISAENTEKPTLVMYLPRLGYEPIPLKRGESNKLYTQGVLGGEKRTFTVDTGCSITTLNTSVGRKLKTLGKLGVKLDDAFLGKVTDPATVLMEKLDLGRAEFVNQPAHVRNLSVVKTDGLLGCDFLYRNYCLIDYLNKCLYVRSSKPSAEIAKALTETLRRSGFSEIPLTLTPELVNTCEAIVNGKPVKLMLDTGAVWSVFDESQVKPLHLKVVGTRVNAVGIGSIGSHRLQHATLKSLEIGGVTLDNVDFGVVDLSSWVPAEDAKKGLGDIGGILGANTLDVNNALIDCRGRRLWLAPKK